MSEQPSGLPPRKYMLRCLKCRWGRTTAGVSEDLKGLVEMPRTCMNCGTPRTFKCPKCGRPVKMLLIKNIASSTQSEKEPPQET